MTMKRSQQGDGVQVGIFGCEELHGDGGHGEDNDHGGKNGEIAEELAESVGNLRKRGGGEDLADTGLTVAVDGVFDDVKADERDETCSDDGY